LGVKLFNTDGRQIQDFRPLDSSMVKMYACGLTVYNYAHIGNLRTYVFEDVLRRILEYAGYKVNHVMNITDVGHLTDDADSGEDKMIKGAREKGKSVWDIARYYTEAFVNDLKELNIKMPTTLCKATEHIQDMIELIQMIEKNGYTYISGGNVYFNIDKFADYGKMALLNPDDLKAGARIEVDQNKKNPLDFVLWFTKSKFEHQSMLWDSPWGLGYPGWHIECSAMAMKYLGEEMDIHCGGVDHISVHHTNEIAQSEGATGKKWVRFWLHGEHLLMGKEKMAKSSGSFLTLQELRNKGFEALDYRYYLLGAHYRSQLEFNLKALEAAKNARTRMGEKIFELKDKAGHSLPEINSLSGHTMSYLNEFVENAFTDMNMPRALSCLWGLLRDEGLKPEEKLACLYEMDRILGLNFYGWNKTVEKVDEETLKLIKKREEARRNKNFKEADEIREILSKRGIILEDTINGTKWKKKGGRKI
jgi:cysteinyl-tRNA synthetase